MRGRKAPRAGAVDYFVNDDLMPDDQFCTAPGNDAHTGTAPDRPLASLLAVLQRACDELFELVRAERLFDIVEGAQPHGIDSRGDGGVRGDHDDLRIDRAFGQRAQELEAVHAGHLEVGHDHIGGPALELLERFDGAAAALHGVSGVAEHVRHRLARAGMVVDDQHAADCG